MSAWLGLKTQRRDGPSLRISQRRNCPGFRIGEMGAVRGSDTSRLTSLFLAWAPGRRERPISEAEKLREEEERVGLGLGGIADLQVDGQEGSWTWGSGNWSELEIKCGSRERTVPLAEVTEEKQAQGCVCWHAGTW